MWVTESGTLVGQGGRRITTGVTPAGKIYVNYEQEPIADDDIIELPSADQLIASGYAPVKPILDTLDAEARAMLLRHIESSYDAAEEIRSPEVQA